jgi:hypothetical protein
MQQQLKLPPHLLLTPFLVLAASLLAGERPYEMVWANRTQDDHPALAPFTDAAGWRGETVDAEARFETSQDVLLFGDAVAKLTYRATGKSPRVTLFPSAPIAVTNAFDAVTCWLYGNNHSYAPDPKTPPVNVSLTFADASNRTFTVNLATVHFKEWFLCHRRLNPDQSARVAQGAKLLSLSVTNGRNTDDRVLYLNSLAVFTEASAPLAFSPRPQRGVSLFPDCAPGANNGPGTLPFPDTPLTVIPRDSAPSVIRVAKSSLGRHLLIRDGEDGRLAVSLPAKAGDWDDLRMRWTDTGDWTPVCLGGGLYFAPEDGKAAPFRATAEEIAITSNGKSVTYAGRLTASNRVANVELRFHLVGKSLVIDLQADGNQIGEVRFGATRGFVNPRPVPLPYYTYGFADAFARPLVIASGSAEAPLFFMAHSDWTLSNASAPWTESQRFDGSLASNGGTRYLPKTDGTRNPCFERFVLTLSPKFEDVLPNIPNPVSPWKHVTGTRVWRAHGAGDRARDAETWRTVRRWGMTQIVVTDHETGWRDGNESFTFRTEPAPKKGGDEGQRRYARVMQDELGFVYGPYNNFTDFAPVNGFWHSDLISRTSDGQLQHAWERCYAPKPARAVEFCERLTPVIEKKFGFSTAYCDVHTAVTPWSRVDFDARVPGAGTFAAVFYAYGEIMLLQKAGWDGPVYSEGNNHFPYCGLTDGNYAQDQSYRPSDNPWLVDFDLRRLHDLCCNFGMGNPDMFYPGKSEPADADAARDRFLAATVAFGHPGFLLYGLDGELRSYYMLQALASLYTQVPADMIRYVAADGETFDTSAALVNGTYTRSQLVTRYADGTLTAANGHPRERLRTVVGGTALDLPPNGYWGRSSNGLVRVFSGEVNGRRADLSVSPDYTYIDGRGAFARFPEGASAGVAICRALTNGFAEILLHKTAEAGFPFAFTEAVALDKAGAVLGPADVQAARGLAYVQPVKGAFSYRVRSAAQPPAAQLACDRDRVAPGDHLTVRGSAAHEVVIPADAKPGARVWQTFEGAWIDFTVIEPALFTAEIDHGTLLVRPISRLSAPCAARLLCAGVTHPFTLEPGTNAPQRLALPSVAVRAEEMTVALHLDAAGLAPLARKLTRQPDLSRNLSLPSARVAGMGLRNASEAPLDTASGAQLRPASSACGGVTKTGGLFMHPPYVKGTGYAFARYALALPQQPLALRCAVGKQDGSDLGDGILFRAVVEDAAGKRTEIASRTVAAHAWHDLEGALAPWAGQSISLLLITDVGAKNNSSGDWGAWADLRLEPPEPAYEWLLSSCN